MKVTPTGQCPKPWGASQGEAVLARGEKYRTLARQERNALRSNLRVGASTRIEEPPTSRPGSNRAPPRLMAVLSPLGLGVRCGPPSAHSAGRGLQPLRRPASPLPTPNPPGYPTLKLFAAFGAPHPPCYRLRFGRGRLWSEPLYR